MKNQYFKLEITQLETGTMGTGEYNCSAKFLSKYLARVLKENPDLIPIFLDATGQALIGSGHAINASQAKTLEYFEPTVKDNRFYDQIFS